MGAGLDSARHRWQPEARLTAPEPGNPYTQQDPEPDQLVILLAEVQLSASAWVAERDRWQTVRAWLVTFLLTLGAVGAVLLFLRH